MDSIIKPSNTRWKILAIVLFLGFIAYIYRTNLSVVGKFMMDDLGISQTELGWLLSAFIWGYTIFQFPGGLFSELVGPRKTMVVVTLGVTVITILMGFIVLMEPSLSILIPLILLCRFLVGAFQGPMFPAVGGGIIARWFPQGSWALPNGMSSTSLALGASVTPPLITLIVQFWGWKLSFFFISILGLIGTIMWWHYAKDWPQDHPSVNDKELELIGRKRKIETPVTLSLVKETLAEKNVLFLSISYLCMNYVFYIFFSWLFIYLVNVRGFSILEGGLLASLPFICGAIAATLGGYMCDRLQKRIGIEWGHKIPIIVGLLPSTVCLIFGSYTQNPYLAVLSLSLCFGFIQLTEGSYWSSLVYISKKSIQGSGGILNTGGNLGGVISTPLVPLLVAQYNWIIALSSGAIFAIAGIIFFLMIKFDNEETNVNE